MAIININLSDFQRENVVNNVDKPRLWFKSLHFAN